jgi:hypothetical protein
VVTCKSGSAGRAGETDQPKGGHRASTRPQPIVQDASLAAALVDRILHHGEVFYLKGPSFRLKGRSLDSELVAAAPASTNGTDAGLQAEHRTGGPEDAVR